MRAIKQGNSLLPAAMDAPRFSNKGWTVIVWNPLKIPVPGKGLV